MTFSKHLFDLAHSIRSQILRGVVKALDDSGGQQKVAVEMHVGQVRSGVPVLQTFGFSSHVPLNGAVTHVLQNGADPSDLFALPPENPSIARMGGLNEGESVVYDAAGQRLHFQDGKLLKVSVQDAIVIEVAGVEIMRVDADGLHIQGSINSTGDQVAGGISTQSHIHGGVKTGPASTGKPE
ncbi:hypothetical protein E3E12_05985 [Formicincola oecophyllae]|uniref:Bacteriophage Mu Gp45 N-terminal domain-containing protein n=1 Tax=Formicincola oecophyllae TaxID=2558361 RepID=A0A4Y6UCF9_9PROT|nr:phage baseplate assembly protein [Formicincola oecophyllae]QDH13805.1 hypothetical protein E3E12_05985 [Formicincola oecophyllae]